MSPDPDDDDHDIWNDGDNPWWHRKHSRQRVQARVAQAIENERLRRALNDQTVQRRHQAQWAKLHERFDPPADHRSLSERLHLPYTMQEPPPETEQAFEEAEADGDDGPPDEMWGRT